jgi:hypothetical protein
MGADPDVVTDFKLPFPHFLKEEKFIEINLLSLGFNAYIRS